MKNKISKLPNGDFQVMREKLRPIHKTPDPDIAILDDIILSAHKRIGLYQTLDKGLWHNIFGTDNTDEIVRERELIRTYETMREEMIQWIDKRKTQS